VARDATAFFRPGLEVRPTIVRRYFRAVPIIALIAAVSSATAQERSTQDTLFRTEYGIRPFLGVHIGLPDAASATLAGAIGLGRLAPGYLFAALEPGYGAGRRSIGWLVRGPDQVEDSPIGSDMGFSIRATELTTYEHVLFFRSGVRYYGPELQLLVFGFGVRAGAYAGAGPHASRLAVSFGFGAGL